MAGLRRSARTASAVYDSNGRQYLASVVGWSRGKLDAWLSSSSVQSHLLLWYNLCYVGGKRFNDGVEWINTGENGYYYNPSDLEEDLLLSCLSEGNVEDLNDQERTGGYVNEKARTYTWTTQEIWARTAWRVVQNNRGPGQAFEKAALEHPAAAYGFAIDVLCLAFHSLAFRRSESVWEDIINQPRKTLLPSPSATESDCEVQIPMEVALDRAPDEEEELQTEQGSIAESELTTIVEDDGEFEDPDMPKTPKTPSPRMNMASPKAPKQARSSIQNVFLDEEKSRRVSEWMATVEDDPMALDLRDENGVPITGYRIAAEDFDD